MRLFEDRELVGVWTSAGNTRRWAFQLIRADQASSYFEGTARTMETGSGPVTFRTARVPASDHRVQLITDFLDRRVLNNVNARLMTVANASHCYDGGNDDVEFDAEVSFVGADVLSVRITSSWFCGAASPTLGRDDSPVFDRRAANGPLGFDDLFRRDVAPERKAAVLFPYRST